VVITRPSPPRLTQSEGVRVARYIAKPADLDEFMAIGTQLREVLIEGKARAHDEYPGSPA
jgi:hypothetical protein